MSTDSTSKSAKRSQQSYLQVSHLYAAKIQTVKKSTHLFGLRPSPNYLGMQLQLNCFISNLNFYISGCGKRNSANCNPRHPSILRMLVVVMSFAAASYLVSVKTTSGDRYSDHIGDKKQSISSVRVWRNLPLLSVHFGEKGKPQTGL